MYTHDVCVYIYIYIYICIYIYIYTNREGAALPFPGNPPGYIHLIGWSNNHFNNLHLNILLETN